MSKVYIVECGGAYKIGMATDVEKRLSQIQTNNPREAHLVAKVGVENASTGHVEKALHMYYEPVRMKGEWFDLPPREAAGFKLVDSIDAEKLDRIVKNQPANADMEERGSLVARLNGGVSNEQSTLSEVTEV
jgi:hypothetical protein